MKYDLAELACGAAIQVDNARLGRNTDLGKLALFRVELVRLAEEVEDLATVTVFVWDVMKQLGLEAKVRDDVVRFLLEECHERLAGPADAQIELLLAFSRLALARRQRHYRGCMSAS